MNYIQNGEAYAYAVKTYSKIRKWCRENDITDFKTFLARIHNEKPDLAVLLDNKPSARMFFLNWFAGMHRYDAITEARKEAREKVRGKGAKHDRRPVPCINIDTGEEFRSFT